MHLWEVFSPCYHFTILGAENGPRKLSFFFIYHYYHASYMKMVAKLEKIEMVVVQVKRQPRVQRTLLVKALQAE